MRESKSESRSVVLETERLQLFPFDSSDAEFLYELMNQPEWIEFIGDRGIESIASAERYVEMKLKEAYRLLGFGLYLLRLKSDGTPIGMVGFVKHPELEDVDIGFALHSPFTANGYALEATQSLLNYARTTLNLPRVVAIVTPNNQRSIRLIEKLGLQYERVVQFVEGGEELRLYSIEL